MDSTNCSDWETWTFASQLSGASEFQQPTPEDAAGILYHFEEYDVAPTAMAFELGGDTPANGTFPSAICPKDMLPRIRSM
jgi:hypothetical protein